MQINLITHNPGKVREFKKILEPKIKVNVIDFDYLELRNDDPLEIAKLAAEQMADKFKKPIVVEDSGLFIPALGDFPGTCSAYVHKRIGLQGILKLMEGKKDRKCFYRSAVGYCEPGKEAVAFLGEEQGTISEKIVGKNGFGHDPIFIPIGEKETYGQLDNVEDTKIFRKAAIQKLLRYLEENSR
jgi:XTP/dITP diphosphohydrolase